MTCSNVYLGLQYCAIASSCITEVTYFNDENRLVWWRKKKKKVLMHHQSSHLDDNNVGRYCLYKAFNIAFIWAFHFWKKLKENPSVIEVSCLARTFVNSICLNNSCIIIIHVVIISSNKLRNIYIFRLVIIQNHWSQLWEKKTRNSDQVNASVELCLLQELKTAVSQQY